VAHEKPQQRNSSVLFLCESTSHVRLHFWGDMEFPMQKQAIRRSIITF